MTQTPPRVDEHTLATLDRWLAYRVWQSRVPGAQVAVGVAGEVLFQRSYGVADLQTGEPLRDDHLFHIASHSKTFTAAAVLQLVEQGRLGLEDPVGRHVPELADGPLAAVAVRELLEHSGGLLRDGRDADHWQHSHPFPDRGRLLTMSQQAIKSAPGELFAYSNLGYGLLGLLIEAITGTSYAEAVSDSLLRPLGLSRTAPSFLSEQADRYASCHGGLHVARERASLPHVDTAALDAATGFTSTATDLVRWFTALSLTDDRLLSERSKRLMQRAVNPTDPEADDPGHYGLGLVVEQVGSHRLVGHSGGYPGHITKTLLDPTTGLVVSVLTNAIDGPATPLATGVLRILDAATEHPADQPPTATALAHVGRYRNPWTVVDIGVVGDRLLALHPTAPSPLDGAARLEVEQDHLLIAAGDGYGSVGEPVRFEGDRLRFAGTLLSPWPELAEG